MFGIHRGLKGYLTTQLLHATVTATVTGFFLVAILMSYARVGGDTPSWSYLHFLFPGIFILIIGLAIYRTARLVNCLRRATDLLTNRPPMPMTLTAWKERVGSMRHRRTLYYVALAPSGQLNTIDRLEIWAPDGRTIDHLLRNQHCPVNVYRTPNGDRPIVIQVGNQYLCSKP